MLWKRCPKLASFPRDLSRQSWVRRSSSASCSIPSSWTLTTRSRIGRTFIWLVTCLPVAISDITLASEEDSTSKRRSSCLPAWSLALNTCTIRASSTEISSQRTSSWSQMAMYASLIWELPKFSGQIIVRTPQARQATWLPKSCADRTIRMVLTTSPSESWAMSSCLDVDPMLAVAVRRSGTWCSLSKYKSRDQTYLKGGRLKLRTSSTR